MGFDADTVVCGTDKAIFYLYVLAARNINTEMCIRDSPNPMARQEDSRYHELLMTNFDPSPMLNRQLSLLDNPGLVSSDRPELRILSAPTGRLPRVWDWPQD